MLWYLQMRVLLLLVIATASADVITHLVRSMTQLGFTVRPSAIDAELAFFQGFFSLSRLSDFSLPQEQCLIFIGIHPRTGSTVVWQARAVHSQVLINTAVFGLCDQPREDGYQAYRLLYIWHDLLGLSQVHYNETELPIMYDRDVTYFCRRLQGRMRSHFD